MEVQDNSYQGISSSWSWNARVVGIKLAADNGYHNIRNKLATELVTLKDKLSFDIWLVLYILHTVFLTVVISNSIDLTIDVKVDSFLIV